MLALFTSCGPPDGLSDAEKLARVDELYDGYRGDFPGVPELSAEELAAARPEDAVVVDVREDDERAVSTIPGALSKEGFEARADELGGRRVVAYCTIGYRSGLYAAELRKKGVDAWNLRGSILAWTHAGQPLVDANGEPTRRVHVYGRTWNLAADGYEAVW